MDEKKFREAFASLAKTDRQALATLIVEYLKPNHITVDIIGAILNTRVLKPGDALVKKVRKGIEVRQLVPGAVHLSSEVTVTERMNYVLEGADIRVVANEWELESGEIGTVQSIRSEMNAKLSDYYINQVFSKLSTLWNDVNTADFYAECSTSVTAAALKDMINTINHYSGSVKAILAVRRTLTPITEFAGYQPYAASPTSWGVAIPSALEEIRQTGFIGVYYGVRNILALPQIWDNLEDFNALLPEDKILVIGDKCGEFITFGEVKVKEWSNMEPTPPLWNLEIYQQWGMIIDNIRHVGVIKIT